MLQYTLKRLLLIIPTFFFVSLVIFFVLNIAPGRPGQSEQAAQAGESANSALQQDSYRFFKEQFNLDKPILLNTRSWLQTGAVREMLVTAHALAGTPTTRDRIKAQNDLDDLGNYGVKHLYDLMRDDSDAEVQRWATWHLTRAAQLSLSDPATDAAERQVIGALNEQMQTLYWPTGADAARVNAVKDAWQTLWHEHHALYEFSTGEAVHALFLDTRFAKYWRNLFHFDFGLSTIDKRPVLPTIGDKLKYSLSLTLVSVLLAYLIAVPIGIFSAVKQGSVADTVTTIVLFLLYSMPTFFTATVLLRLLSEGEPVAWFPTGGFSTMGVGDETTWQHTKDILWHLVLPVVTYTSVTLAALSRYARTGVIDVIRSDYVRTARAKGLHEVVVIVKHAARNGMIPILTLLGSLLPVLVSGSVVIEVVFNIPGMGLYLFDAINLRDYNAVMGVLIIATVLTLVGILISDLSYGLADPRISFD